jgi:hypothetical protein
VCGIDLIVYNKYYIFTCAYVFFLLLLLGGGGNYCNFLSGLYKKHGDYKCVCVSVILGVTVWFQSFFSNFYLCMCGFAETRSQQAAFQDCSDSEAQPVLKKGTSCTFCMPEWGETAFIV